MTPHEKALVTVLLERLKKTDSPDKDPEAETLIRQTTAEQPDAAYHLVQTVLIQDLSLQVAQNRIAELEKNLVEAKAVPFLPRSFLGGISIPYEPAPKAVAPPAESAATIPKLWPAPTSLSGIQRKPGKATIADMDRDFLSKGWSYAAPS